MCNAAEEPVKISHGAALGEEQSGEEEAKCRTSTMMPTDCVFSSFIMIGLSAMTGGDSAGSCCIAAASHKCNNRHTFHLHVPQ